MLFRNKIQVPPTFRKFASSHSAVTETFVSAGFRELKEVWRGFLLLRKNVKSENHTRVCSAGTEAAAPGAVSVILGVVLFGVSW